MSLTFRFDDPAPDTFQPIITLRDPAIYQTSITLFQSPGGTGFHFTVHNFTGDAKLEIETGLFTQGEVATFKVGVATDGTMYIQKKGGTMYTIEGKIPENLPRPETLLGTFSDCGICQPMRGALLDLSIRNLDEPFHPRIFELKNIPSQIRDSPFVVSFYARVDVLTGTPYIFCLADASPYTNYVSFRVLNTTGAAEFSMRLSDNSEASLVVDSAITADTMNFWHLSYNPSGLMEMDRDGTVLGSTTVTSTPTSVFRSAAGFGQGCAGPTDSPLDGVVLGLRVDLFATT